jgi:hypothetical protein
MDSQFGFLREIHSQSIREGLPSVIHRVISIASRVLPLAHPSDLPLTNFEANFLESFLSNEIPLAAMKIATVVATSLIVGSVTASKSTKVGVTCKNLDVNALSPKALAYAAKAVEMTYDAVNKQEGAHAVAVGTFATDSSLRSKVSARDMLEMMWLCLVSFFLVSFLAFSRSSYSRRASPSR